MSFLSSASIVLSDENVTKMYSFVCTSAFACTANCKSEGQIKARHPVLRIGNMHHKNFCTRLLRWIPNFDPVPNLHS